MRNANEISDESFPRGAPSFALPAGHHRAPSAEIVVEETHPTEVVLPVDAMEAVKRRVLIAYQAYGPASIGRIAAFVGLHPKKAQELLASEDIQQAIKSGMVSCWTPTEIVARISVEAETAQRPLDRLAALKLLMEYRSMSAPEGGSRSFKRIAAKFQVGGENVLGG